MLGRRDVLDARGLALAQRRQLALGLFGVVVAALGVDACEALEDRARGGRAQAVAVRRQLDRGRLELLRRHLRGDRALPDQAVEAQLVAVELAGERLGIAREAGRPDGLVRLLGALGRGLVDAALGLHELRTEPLRGDRHGLLHGDAGHGRRVGSHVGDEADLALGGLEALVEALRGAHGAARVEAELAAGLLLQRAGGERRRRVAARWCACRSIRCAVGSASMASACAAADSPSATSAFLPSIVVEVGA